MRVERVDGSSASRASERATEKHASPRDAQKLSREEFASRQQRLERDLDINEDHLEEHIDLLNDTLRTFDKRLRFDIHRDTEQIYTQVIDAETEEILREIPPEEVLNMVARIDELVGLIVDEKV